MQFLSPAQCRAARGLLDWSQPDLAQKCGMHVQTICAFEKEMSTPTKTTLEKITKAFEDIGVEFTADQGVRKMPSGFKIYRGNEGFRRFYDDLFLTAKTIGGDICLFNGVSVLVRDALGTDYMEVHKKRMLKIKNNFTYRVIVQHDDNIFLGAEYCEYKWFPPKLFNNKTFFVFGSKVGFVIFEKNNLRVILIDQKEIAQSQLLLFDLAWDHIAKKPPKKKKS